MKYFKVPVEIRNYEHWIVEANDKMEAVDKACDGDGYLIRDIEGDAEVRPELVEEMKEDSKEVFDYFNWLNMMKSINKD